jgi:hypothetical protein
LGACDGSGAHGPGLEWCVASERADWHRWIGIRRRRGPGLVVMGRGRLVSEVAHVKGVVGDEADGAVAVAARESVRREDVGCSGHQLHRHVMVFIWARG